MSLEDVIKENTAVMRELVEALTRGALPEAQAAAKQRTLGEVIGAKKPADTAAAAKPAATTTPKAEAAKPAPKTTGPKTAAKATTDDAYAPVGAAITAAVAAGHKNSVKNILAEYDVAKGSELDPSTYAEVLEKLNLIMNGEVDDLS